MKEGENWIYFKLFLKFNFNIILNKNKNKSTMPVIKMMTIIVLVALMAIAMGEMSEASSTSFAMEEESTRIARMILNNNKSSTKFFMKENNKDEGGVPCLDDLYDVPRKEENVLGKKKNKENSEVKNQRQRRKSGWKNRARKEDSLTLKYVGAHNTFHFTSCIPWQVVEVAPFWRGGDGNYEWRGCKDPKNFKTTQKALSLPFFPERWLFYHLLEVGGNGRTKKKKREGENDFNQKQSFLLLMEI